MGFRDLGPFGRVLVFIFFFFFFGGGGGVGGLSYLREATWPRNMVGAFQPLEGSAEVGALASSRVH